MKASEQTALQTELRLLVGAAEPHPTLAHARRRLRSFSLKKQQDCREALLLAWYLAVLDRRDEALALLAVLGRGLRALADWYFAPSFLEGVCALEARLHRTAGRRAAARKALADVEDAGFTKRELQLTLGKCDAWFAGAIDHRSRARGPAGYGTAAWALVALSVRAESARAGFAHRSRIPMAEYARRERRGVALVRDLLGPAPSASAARTRRTGGGSRPSRARARSGR